VQAEVLRTSSELIVCVGVCWVGDNAISLFFSMWLLRNCKILEVETWHQRDRCRESDKRGRL